MVNLASPNLIGPLTKLTESLDVSSDLKFSVQWNLVNPKSLGPEGVQISEMFD